MWHRITSSVLFNLFSLILVSFLLWNAVRMGQEAFVLRKERMNLEGEVAALIQKKSMLEARFAELNTRQAVEREAKARLNLKLPGEEVVVVVPQEKKEQAAEVSKDLWSRVLQFLRLR